MQGLEEKRLEVLKDKGQGLIIPIVLRGEKRFPAALSQERLYYSFTDIQFNNPVDKLRVKYAEQIKEMAEYIVERCFKMDEVADQLPHDCDTFALPL
jgi:hypothetical protein